ncbi:uncharacterized protein LOC117181894 [Belonocnema kinseyi]|uniref:uncharacterized protein LOC117181894 n=1 Tax=Belonocnema kinseyi TaxID=2817044 RepID=UPI00143CE9BD|nr:uncharacterized protein LOC117181894 [Belonocnema kinseyi]
MDNRQQDKQYLEPGSQDPIPSSSWYRYKKLSNKGVTDDPSQFATRNTENEQVMDYNFSNSDNIMEEQILQEYSKEKLSTKMAFSSSQKDSINEELFSSKNQVFLPTQLPTAYEEEDVYAHEIVQSLSNELDGIENCNFVKHHGALMIN